MSHHDVTVRSREEVVRGLKAIRLRRNWTYDQLAADAKVSRRNLIRLMTTNGGVRERTLFQLSEYIDGAFGASSPEAAR